MEFGNNSEENTVEVFGEDNAESTTDTTTDVQTETTDTDTDTNTDANTEKETETDKDKDKKDTDTTTDVDDKEQNKDKEGDDKPFKVSFGKKDEKAEKPATDDKKETMSVTEEMVVDFLKKKGIDVSETSQLSKTVELSDEVLQFQKFVAETGRGHRDFYNSQKDWSKESEDNTLREFYKLKHGLSDENVEKHLSLLKISEDEKDTLSDRDISVREVEFDDKYKEALDFMTDKSKEYKTSLENRESQQKPLTKEEIIEAHKPYWGRRDKSLEKLTDVKMSFGDIGEVSSVITQEQKDLIAEVTQTDDSYFNRFKDDKDNPLRINTDLSNEATMWGIKEIREKILTDYSEQMFTLFMTEFSKKNRNVDLDNIDKKERSTENSQSSLEVIGEDGTTKMGTSILG